MDQCHVYYNEYGPMYLSQIWVVKTLLQSFFVHIHLFKKLCYHKFLPSFLHCRNIIMSLLICPYSLLAAKYRNRNDRPCYKDNLTYWVPFDDLVIHLKYGMHFFCFMFLVIVTLFLYLQKCYAPFWNWHTMLEKKPIYSLYPQMTPSYFKSAECQKFTFILAPWFYVFGHCDLVF